MCEACTEIDTRFEAVAKAAAPLGSRLPRVRDPVLGRWIAQQMSALLRNVTAGHAALDVSIGEGLEALKRRTPRDGPELLQHRRRRPGRARHQREHRDEDGAAGAEAPGPAAGEGGSAAGRVDRAQGRKYNGAGDPNSAASFTCARSAGRGEDDADDD